MDFVISLIFAAVICVAFFASMPWLYRIFERPVGWYMRWVDRKLEGR